MISQASPLIVPSDEGVIAPLPVGAHMLFHSHDINGARNRSLNGLDIGESFFRPWMNHARQPNAVPNMATTLSGSSFPVLLFPPVNVAAGAVQSLQFNGSDSTFTISPNPDNQLDFIHQTGVFDLFIAFKPYSAGTQGDFMGNVDDISTVVPPHTGTQAGFQFFIGSGNNIEAHVYASTGVPVVDAVASGSVPTGVWNKLMIRGDGSSIYISLNTTFQSQSWVAPTPVIFTGPLDPGNSSNNVTVGNRFGRPGIVNPTVQPDSVHNFSGEIAEICLWNRNLSTNELNIVDDFFNDRVRSGPTWG